MPNPAPACLTVTAQPIWARVPAGPATIPVVVELTAEDVALEQRRAALALCLVLDVSGSMAGPPLEHVVRSVERILGLLRDEDQVAVVAFSTRATLVSKMSALDAATRRAIASRVARLGADDRTNIEAGLLLAAQQIPSARDDLKTAIVLLSDGEPNEGAATTAALAAVAEAIRPKASISTLGYGVRHDERVLLAIAEAGGGAYRFIADPGTCQLELAQAVGTQGDIAVDGIELVLVPEPGVEIQRVIGAPAPRFSQDGLLVSVPDLAARTSRALVVETRARLDVERLGGKLLTVRARHRQAGFVEQRMVEATAHIDIGGNKPAPHEQAFATALLVRADAVRAEARGLADRGQFDGAAAILRRFMEEIEAAPGYVAADGSALSEAWEQLLDEAMAMERRPSREALSALKAGAATRALSMTDGIRASSKPLGRTANHMTLALGGPKAGSACLLVVRGPNAGTRHALGLQNTIGRTSSADIPIASSHVSRRHADIFVLQGDYFLADLGSTNVTKVNDKRLGTQPHMLKHGDKVVIGDVHLVFERA
ncbi:MAG: FHA domain-containing protein [Polyangiaceae bacterium]|nr:FHA domain-containing protein [Polyangiaceae bacterium]